MPSLSSWASLRYACAGYVCLWSFYVALSQAAPVINISPLVMPRSGSWLTVTWSGVSSPEFGDVLAIYPLGYDSGLARLTVQPIKYVWASQVSNQTWRSGYGTVRLWLPNLRVPVQALYIRGVGYAANMAGLSSVLVAKSPLVVFANPFEPLNGRLSLTDNAGQVTVTWQVKAQANLIYNPVVQVRSFLPHNPTNPYVATFQATTSTFQPTDLCGGIANGSGWMDPGYINTAVLSGLYEGYTFNYRYGDLNLGFSDYFTFRMAPGQDPTARVRILAMADVGAYNPDGSYQPEGDLITGLQASFGVPIEPPLNPTSTYGAFWNSFRLVNGLINPQPPSKYTFAALSAELDEEAADVLIHNGDISYARGLMSQWDTYLNNLMPLATRVPYMIGIGNHEFDMPDGLYPGNVDSGGECGVTTARLLPQPYQSVPDRLYYSFNVGPIHFLQMSTEVNFSAGSTQHQWVLSDLSSLNRSLSPWVVVGMHRPMYSDDFDCCKWGGIQGTALELQAALEEMFYIYGVDMVWTGHTHAYTRTCPVFNGTCQGWTEDGQAKAPVHAQFGNGGFTIRPNSYPGKPDWAMVSSFEYGYAVVDANATHLNFTAKAASDRHVMDRLVLKKPLGWTLDAEQNKQNLVSIKNNLTYPLIPFPTMPYSAIGDILFSITSTGFKPPNVTSALQAALWGPGTLVNKLASGVYMGSSNVTLLNFWYINQACCIYLSQSPFMASRTTKQVINNYCGLYQPGGRIYNMTVQESGVAPVLAYNATAAGMPDMQMLAPISGAVRDPSTRRQMMQARLLKEQVPGGKLSIPLKKRKHRVRKALRGL